MKVYRVTASYYSGDHEAGYYQSPMYAKREDAEGFKAALLEKRDGWDINWSVGHSFSTPEQDADYIRVEEMEVLEAFDGEIKKAREYLHVTYT